MRPIAVLIFLLLCSTSFAEDAKSPPAAAKVVQPAAAPVVTVKHSVVTAPDLPVVPGEPTSPAEALANGQQVIGYAKAKNWFGVSGVSILILMYLLKAFGLFKKIGKRWSYIAVPVLGLAAMLLCKFAGGVSWDSAWLVFFSGPGAALVNDFLKRGIMNQEPSPMGPVQPGS